MFGFLSSNRTRGLNAGRAFPLLCLGSRRGGKKTRAASLHAPTAGFNSPPARQVNLCRDQYVNLVRFIFFWLNRHSGHVQLGLSLYNAFILCTLIGGEGRKWEARWKRGARQGKSLCRRTNIFSLLSISFFFPSPEPCHEIPHMPLIWNEAAQEWTYLTAVEFFHSCLQCEPRSN